MATIKVNLVDTNTGLPLAPFFYNMVAGDSYIVAPYSQGGTESNENTVRIQVKDSAGADKEYISINRYQGSSNNKSMPECLDTGVQKSIDAPYRLESGNSVDAVWNKLSGEAWDECVDDATSNGGEPGLFQEAIWYMTESDADLFAESQSRWKQENSEVEQKINEAATAADDAGFATFRTPGAGIAPVNGYNAGDLAFAIVGPNLDIPHLMKIGVTYESATVTAGAIPT